MNLPKITPYYTQLTKTHVGLNLDLQPKAQKEAHVVGSQKCKECHEEESHDGKEDFRLGNYQWNEENLKTWGRLDWEKLELPDNTFR